MEAAERCRRQGRRGRFDCARHHLDLRQRPIESFRHRPGLACLGVGERCRCLCRAANSSGSRRPRCRRVRHARLLAEELRSAIQRRSCCLARLQPLGFPAEVERCRPIRRRGIRCFHQFRNRPAVRVAEAPLAIRRRRHRCRALLRRPESMGAGARCWKPMLSASGHHRGRRLRRQKVAERQFAANRFRASQRGRRRSRRDLEAGEQLHRCRRNLQTSFRFSAPNFVASAEEQRPRLPARPHCVRLKCRLYQAEAL